MTRPTDYTKIKPGDFYEHISSDEAHPDLLHHVATHPETDAYDLGRISDHPSATAQTLQHIHDNIINSPDEAQKNRMDKWDRARVSRSIISHPNSPSHLVKAAHDKMEESEYRRNPEIAMHPSLPVDHLLGKFKKETNDFKDLDGDTHDDLVRHLGKHPEITPEHMEQFANHEQIGIAKAAMVSPKLTLDQQKKIWSHKDMNYDHKRDLISTHTHFSPEFLQHAHEDIRSKMDKMSEAKQHDTRDYRDAHYAMEDTIKHPSLSKELIEHYSKSSNDDFKQAAIHNPSFDRDKLHELAMAGDKHGVSAFWEREHNAKDIHPDTMRKLHGQIKPDKDKYMASSQRNLLRHPSTPDDVLKERSEVGAYAAQAILERKNLSPDVLKHLVNHKTKSVALAALDHPNVNEEVIDTALKRKMKEVNQKASLHSLAPKESKFEKFLKDPSAVKVGMEKGLHDDPEFIRKAVDKFPNDSDLHMDLLKNKHISPTDFNSMMGSFERKLNAAEAEPEEYMAHFPESKKLADAADAIVTNHTNIDEQGRKHVIRLLPHVAHKLPNLTHEEMKEGLDMWNGKSQEQATKMASDLFHHDNLSPDLAKRMLVGDFGQVEPDNGRWSTGGNKIAKSIHEKPHIFTEDVIKAGLGARREFQHEDTVKAMASAPQFNPRNFEEIFDSFNPEGGGEHESNIYNAAIGGLYQNPNISADHIKEALKGDDWYEDALKNPSLSHDDLIEYASHAHHDEDGEALISRFKMATLAHAIHEKGLTPKALTTVSDTRIADKILEKNYSTDKAKMFNKHLGDIVKKNPNHEIIKTIMQSHVEGMDDKILSKIADKLADHPDPSVRSAAFKSMSDPKKQEYIDKHGKSDPNIISGFNRDQIRNLKITPDMSHEAVSAVIDNRHADHEHFKAAVEHSPEAALRVVQHATNHVTQKPYIEPIRKGYRKDKKERLLEQNRKSVADTESVRLKGRELIQKAIEKYPDNDEMMKTIVDKASGLDLSTGLMENEKVSHAVKASILRKSPASAWSLKSLERFKDTQDPEMVDALVRSQIDDKYFTHLAKNVNDAGAAYTLASARKIDNNVDAQKALMRHDDEDVKVALADNDHVDPAIREELLKDPNILLRSYNGATDTHLDNLLETHAHNDPKLYAKIAAHSSSSDDLRSKVIKEVGKKLDAFQKESIDGGKEESDLSDHPDFEHFNEAISSAIHSLSRDKRVHGEAQQYLGKYGDQNTVNSFLSMKRGKTIDDKFAQQVADRFHDGNRSEYTESLLECRFKNPNLSLKLIDDAGSAGNLQHVANHIARNKLEDKAYETAYLHLKNSHPDSQGQKDLLKQLATKAHPEITNELLAAHPDLIFVASKNKRVDGAKFNEAFHSSIDRFVENGDTNIPGDGFDTILNSPHISGDDLRKAYNKVRKKDENSKFDYLRKSIANNSKTNPDTLEDIFKHHKDTDAWDAAIKNPNTPDEIVRKVLYDAITDTNNSLLGKVAENKKIRIKDFEAAMHDAMGEPHEPLRAEFYMNLVANHSAHPDDLSKLYRHAYETKERKHSKNFPWKYHNSVYDELRKNPNTTEEILQHMLDNGVADEDDLIEHPTIGGKIFRSKEHHFPNVPGLKKGNELNQVQYKPKQEKFQAVINMMPEEGMDWATFKKQEPKLAGDPDIQKMFVKQPKQRLTKELGQQHLESLPGNSFHISYRHWNGMQRHDSSVDQLVMQINNSEEHDAELRKDPKLFKLYKMAQAGSNYSGHPVGPHSLAWSRIDTSNKDHWFIDEAQSDMNSSLSKVLREVEESGQATSLQQKYGLTPEEADTLVPKLQEVLRNWDKAALNGIIELARKHGVKRVSMHSGESKTAFNKPGEEVTNKYNKIYNEAANAVGLNKKVPYSTVPNHEKSKGHVPIWTMDLSGQDDETKKSEWAMDIGDILKNLRKSSVQPKKKK